LENQSRITKPYSPFFFLILPPSSLGSRATTYIDAIPRQGYEFHSRGPAVLDVDDLDTLQAGTAGGDLGGTKRGRREGSARVK